MDKYCPGDQKYQIKIDILHRLSKEKNYIATGSHAARKLAEWQE
jgi:hypothetical protein